MRTPIEALKEIRDRLTYFCLRTDGRYDPPWATELVGIIDDILKYKKNTDNPFYVDIGTSVVAIRCSSNHDVVHRLDHAYNKGSIVYLEQMCARMNEEALGLQKPGNAAAMREALENAHSLICEGIETEVDDEIEHPFHLELACEVIQRALAEPPRNCDKMPDIDNLTMHDLAKSPCKSTLEYASREELLALVRWLLAPAAERKGESDGSK